MLSYCRGLPFGSGDVTTECEVDGERVGGKGFHGRGGDWRVHLRSSSGLGLSFFSEFTGVRS